MTPPTSGELTLDAVLADLQTIARVVIEEEEQGKASYETVQKRLGDLSLHVLTYIRFLETSGYVNYDRSNDRITITDLGRAAADEPEVWRDEAEAEFILEETGVHRIGDTAFGDPGLGSDMDDMLDGLDLDLDSALEEISNSAIEPARLTVPSSPVQQPEESTQPAIAAVSEPEPEPEPAEPARPKIQVPKATPRSQQTEAAQPDETASEGKGMSNDSFSSRRISTQSPAAGRAASSGTGTLYERGEAVGSGGIGTVFQGTQVKLGRQVAIKEIKEIFDVFAGVQRSDIVARFQEIVQTQAQLLHPNIIQIVDIDTDAQFPFVVMQYAPNGNLRRLIDIEDRPPLQTALKYFLQILHALSTAHENGVTHGGIKPENVVLDHAGNALMTDFGMSGVAELDANRGASQVYVGVGTVAYMSPEQFKDPNTSTVKSDIYSLGIMFYEMLTGKVPGRRSPMPSSFYPDIPRALDDVFDRMSMDDVDERYESIDEVLADIYASEDVMEIIDKRGGFLFLRDPMSAGGLPAGGGAGFAAGADDDLDDDSESSDAEELSEPSEPSEVSEVSEASEASDAEDDESDDEDGGDGDDVLSKLDKYGEMFDEEDDDSEADEDSEADDDDSDADEDDED